MTQHPSNALLIMCDQLRFDALGVHGNPVAQTPNLDRLAESGTTFRRTYTESPVCVPARSVLMTGRLPHQTGVVDNGTPLPSATPTLVTELARSGRHCQAIGKMHFDPVREPHGHHEMWLSEERPQSPQVDEYLTDLIAAGYSHVLEPHGVRHELYYSPQPAQVPAELTTTAWTARRTVQYLTDAAAEQRPFFCWTSFIKPHPPFDPPAPWYLEFDPLSMPDPVRNETELTRLPYYTRVQHRSKWTTPRLDANRIRTMRAYYHALVSFVDHEIGTILDALDRLGLRDSTLVIFTADHGEYLGDHWAFGKRGFHDAAARIPLIMSMPNTVPPGRQIDALTGLQDVAPTLLAAAGVTARQLEPEGFDLSGLATGATQRVREFLIGQFAARERGLYLSTDGSYKYVYTAADRQELLLRVGAEDKETLDFSQDPHYTDELHRLRSHIINRFTVDGYHDAVRDGRWRDYPPPPDIPDLADRTDEGRNRQYPRWMASTDRGDDTPAPSTSSDRSRSSK